MLSSKRGYNSISTWMSFTCKVMIVPGMHRQLIVSSEFPLGLLGFLGRVSRMAYRVTAREACSVQPRDMAY